MAKAEINVNGCVITIDPTDKNPHMNPAEIFSRYTGLIPQWLDMSNNKPMYVQATEGYEYYMKDMDGGIVNRKSLEYAYPGDPTLPPMVIFKRVIELHDGSHTEDIMVVYDMAFVAGIYKDSQESEETIRITRMD